MNHDALIGQKYLIKKIRKNMLRAMNKETKDLPERLTFIFRSLEIIYGRKENAGIIECPKCKGELKYTRAPNGHVWGKCKTENCLSWVQ